MFLQDVDDFFQNERDHNLVLTGCTKNAAEVSQSPACLWFIYLSPSLFPSLIQPVMQSCFIFELIFSHPFSLQRFLDVVQTEQSKKTAALVENKLWDLCLSRFNS